MREWRNPAYRREWIAYAAAAAVLAALGGWLAGPLCACLLLAGGAVFIGLHAFFTRRRYRAIARLGDELDRVLHGEMTEPIGDSDEGELAILRSEIGKMTRRLQEGSEALLADKKLLSRSMEDIFHQLRTPLTAVNLEMTLLSREDLPYERRLRLTREVQKQLEQMNWLVDTLLKMSQLDAGTVALRQDDVAVAALVEKASASLLIPMELRGQELRISVKEEHFTGDLLWTAEALSNLLKNCMEHTPAGGSVTVAAEETALFTQITVQDTGPGFDPAELPRLFERFYKGKSSGGVGIGLAMSRMVAAAQNGTLTAANAPGGGARFTLRFYKSVI